MIKTRMHSDCAPVTLAQCAMRTHMYTTCWQSKIGTVCSHCICPNDGCGVFGCLRLFISNSFSSAFRHFHSLDTVDAFPKRFECIRRQSPDFCTCFGNAGEDEDERSGRQKYSSLKENEKTQFERTIFRSSRTFSSSPSCTWMSSRDRPFCSIARILFDRKKPINQSYNRKRNPQAWTQEKRTTFGFGYAFFLLGLFPYDFRNEHISFDPPKTGVVGVTWKRRTTNRWKETKSFKQMNE